MAGKKQVRQTVPWHEAAESQLTRLRNDRGKVIADAVETMAECAAITLGMQQVTIQVYMAGRGMIFSLMGLVDESATQATDSPDGVGWYTDRMNAGNAGRQR